MWRFRSLAILGVMAVVLLVGTVVVYAGEWWWNAQIKVEGVEVRTVWTVNADDRSSNYRAAITIVLPEGAQAALNELASNETVTFATDAGLTCNSNSVAATVIYNVTALNGATGNRAKVDAVVDGVRLGWHTGALGEDIAVDVEIAADNPSCE